jgi:antitoxin MazE
MRVYDKGFAWGARMKLTKWGNSLALRIPVEMAAKLNFSPGVEVVARITEKNTLEIVRDRRREEAIETLRKLRFDVPADYKFDRNELYE